MTQSSQASRLAPRTKRQSGPPGVGLSIAVAIISGVVCWFWLVSGGANSPRSTAPNMSSLTEVEDAEVADALTTMSLPNAVRAQFRAAKDGTCPRPLAWVSLATPPGEPPSHIRLISGTYYSPVFEVSATPVRVALPFPAPYATGHGALTAIDVGGSATIALLPVWRVSAQDGRATRAVTSQPAKTCGPRHG